MHGKIAIYMDSTGRGTVTNSAKLFFESNRRSWSGRRSMPSVGMLVEFRTEGRTITSARPSRYQEFKEGDFITGNDFWWTESDEALEDLQNSRCSAYITELYRGTDYNTIEKIPLSFTIPQAIQKYFVGEILSVEALKQNVDDEEEIPCVLDYFVLKRFLTKSLDTLIFMGHSADQTQFSSLKSIIMHLENSYNDMKDKHKMINITKIFNDTFLSLRCHYQALIFTIDTRESRAQFLEAQMKISTSEMNARAATMDPVKMQAKQERFDKLAKETTYYRISLKRLEAVRGDFYKKNFNIFEDAFKLSREKLFSKIVAGLNLCATIMDMKIWKLSLKSSGVKNSYFTRSNIENSFCSLVFAEHYLSRLNKSALNPLDQKLLVYIEKITKEQRKKFLVVASDLGLLCRVKVGVFALNLYYIVKYVPKRVNYQSLMRDNNLDIVYIDEAHIWDSAADIILQGKYFDKTGKTKFKLV